MISIFRIILQFAATIICSCIMTSCHSEMDDNQSQITGVGPDGKVSVVGAILKNNTRNAISYSGYLSGIGPLSKQKRDYFLQWLSENVDVNYVCSAILDDGSLSILYCNQKKQTSRIEIDFLERSNQITQQFNGN